jgi:hypothetical protein
MGNEATEQHATSAPPGLTLERYADWAKLPVAYLKELGLSTIHYNGSPTIKVPYYDATGREITARFMTHVPCLGRADTYPWKRKTRPQIYGLSRLHEAEESGVLVIVGSEIDCHVLWFHEIPAIAVTDPTVRGLPELLEPRHGIKKIQVLENCGATEAAVAELAKSALKDRVVLAKLTGEYRSLVEIHRDSPDAFKKAVKEHSSKRGLARREAEVRERRKEEAWEVCGDLAGEREILKVFAGDFRKRGIVGEERLGKLTFLAATSRLLERPVSIAVKGPSSCGKSATTGEVLKFFPEDAYHAVSTMSPKALLYSPEPMEHRMLVIYEVAGVKGTFAEFLIRNLLSEGKVSGEVTTNAGGMPTTVRVTKEGPTGLITTTTLPSWHEENETRYFSVPVDDSHEQTIRVMNATASERETVDMDRWHALQEWIQLGEHRVDIPFAEAITPLIVGDLPPRMRRDHKALLSLVGASAVLHQATRSRDENGRIIAELGDYATARDLVADIIAEGIRASVPQTVRETVEAVKTLIAESPDGVSETALASALARDKSVVSRRLKVAREAGYVTNLEHRQGCPSRWVLDDPMPDDTDILPTVEELKEALQRCSGDAAA